MTRICQYKKIRVEKSTLINYSSLVIVSTSPLALVTCNPFEVNSMFVIAVFNMLVISIKASFRSVEVNPSIEANDVKTSSPFITIFESNLLATYSFYIIAISSFIFKHKKNDLYSYYYTNHFFCYFFNLFALLLKINYYLYFILSED